MGSHGNRTAVSARSGSGLAMRQLAKRSNSTDNTGLDMAKSRGDWKSHDLQKCGRATNGVAVEMRINEKNRLSTE